MNDSIEDLVQLIERLFVETEDNQNNQNQKMAEFHSSFLDIIPKYAGEASELADFLSACELIVTQFQDAANPQAFINKFLLTAIKNKLTGQAKVVTGSREINTWRALKNILQLNFADQRDENSLLRDLMLLKQENETPQQFYIRCQDMKSLLLSNLAVTEPNEGIRIVKRNMFDNLTLKSFLSGLREPLGSIIRSRNPQTLEAAQAQILNEENILYVKNRTNYLIQNKSRELKSNNSPMHFINRNATQHSSNHQPSHPNQGRTQFHSRPQPQMQRIHQQNTGQRNISNRFPRQPIYHQVPTMPNYQQNYPQNLQQNQYPNLNQNPNPRNFQRNVFAPNPNARHNFPRPIAMETQTIRNQVVPMDTQTARPTQNSNQNQRRKYTFEELYHNDNDSPQTSYLPFPNELEENESDENGTFAQFQGQTFATTDSNEAVIPEEISPNQNFWLTPPLEDQT